jgi:hypothetical protein
MSLGVFWDFLSVEDSQQISFYKVRLASRPTPNLEVQAFVFMTSGDRVAQQYPRTLGSSGTSGWPFPVPIYVISSKFLNVLKQTSCFQLQLLICCVCLNQILLLVRILFQTVPFAV